MLFDINFTNFGGNFRLCLCGRRGNRFLRTAGKLQPDFINISQDSIHITDHFSNSRSFFNITRHSSLKLEGLFH